MPVDDQELTLTRPDDEAARLVCDQFVALSEKQEKDKKLYVAEQYEILGQGLVACLPGLSPRDAFHLLVAGGGLNGKLAFVVGQLCGVPGMVGRDAPDMKALDPTSGSPEK